MNEAEIITGCKKGERKAQQLIFERYAEVMLLVCMRYVRNRADAEELMLGGFYKFFTKTDKFVYAGEGSVRPWLRKIMVNECLMFLRKKGQLIMAEESLALNVVTDNGIVDRLNAAELFKLVSELPPGYGTVFNLYVMEQMTHKEIAGLLNITEGTSKSQLNKARIALQKAILKREEYDAGRER